MRREADGRRQEADGSAAASWAVARARNSCGDLLEREEAGEMADGGRQVEC